MFRLADSTLGQKALSFIGPSMEYDPKKYIYIYIYI